MFLENGKRQFCGDLGMYGSLSGGGINKLIKAFITRKRIETWLDYGSGNNGITGKTLDPYTIKELAAVLWPGQDVEKMVLFLDKDKINDHGSEYRTIAKQLTLSLASLYCKTRFVDDKNRIGE